MVRAAGAVLWRRGAGSEGVESIEVLVVHRPRYDDWSLPKGKLDDGETWHDAARREVQEETGIVGELGAELSGCAYRVPAGPKAVRYWAMEVDTGSGDDFVANDEVDAVRWCGVAEASAVVHQPTDRIVLGSFGMGLSANLVR
ncbi:MAG: NUDIX hydrolase [Acidimicrobiia bacterium]|nr:NUDIX hydrolase [Acidimicrobiia bacterium]